MVVETGRKMRRRGYWLCWIGWALFALSLALPAIHVLEWESGWFCFRSVFEIAWGTATGQGGVPFGRGFGLDLYYSGFAVANSLMVACPALIWRFRVDARRLRRASALLAGTMLYAASYLVLAIDGGMDSLGDLHVGYYAWLCSFLLVTAGVLHLSAGVSRTKIEPAQNGGSSTLEELAAIRELDGYLNGSTARCHSTERIVLRIVAEESFRGRDVHGVETVVR